MLIFFSSRFKESIVLGMLLVSGSGQCRKHKKTFGIIFTSAIKDCIKLIINTNSKTAEVTDYFAGIFKLCLGHKDK